jgi:arginine-tRNA-protein transferase
MRSGHDTRTESLRRAIEQGKLEPGWEHPCSYLPGLSARHQAFIASRLAPGIYHSLMDLNFRRSGSVFYRPACGRCRECRAIRVPVDEFQPSRAQRRCWRRNQDMYVELGEPAPTHEKHQLYRRYLAMRHDRQMGGAWAEFCEFLYDSPVQTIEVTFRLAERLVAVGIVDAEPDALSTVYCYFDPDEPQRSLGVYNVLWTIEHCRRQHVPYLYLGYYVRDCAKMNYKAGFRPCELLGPDGQWRRME